MGAKELITNFFEESEEEIKEELKEARKTVRELNEKLKNVQENKAEIEKERARLERQKKLRKQKRNFFVIGLLIGLVVVIVIGAISYLIYSNLSNRCSEMDKLSGDFVIGCIKSDEPEKSDLHKISFFFKNNMAESAKCMVQATTKVNDIEISNKDFDLGTFMAKETKRETIELLLPAGNSEFELAPICTK